MTYYWLMQTRILQCLDLYRNLDIKNDYILRTFLGCIIYAILLFVINAEPSFDDITAAYELKFIITIIKRANALLNILLNLYFFLNL